MASQSYNASAGHTQTDGQVESIMPPAETAGPHDGSRETDCTEGETTFMAIELFQLPV